MNEHSHAQTICACGCGQPIPWKPYHKYQPPRYVPGHARAKRIYPPITEEGSNGLCACGCGQSIPWKPHHRYHPPRYLPNHSLLATHQKKIYVPKPEEIPSGLCECGCGKPTPLAKATYRHKRHFRGHPIPFLHGHNPMPKGPNSHKWKGGHTRTNRGYVLTYAPDHPKANPDGYVLEHRLVMEQHLGRFLETNEIVHHINRDKKDNRLENLVVLSQRKHGTHHAPDHVAGGLVFCQVLRDICQHCASYHWCHKD